MRVVEYNHKKLKLPDGWEQKAAGLSEQMLAEADAGKRNIILDKNGIWADVKSELKKVFHEKCWYTESPQVGTDVDVDHFRPKKRVAERSKADDAHPGYWWLAYDLENYRYSCLFANRLRRDIETDIVGGKADRFPIDDEATRAMEPAANWRAEKTLLIDPCKADEVALITFREDGEAMSRFPIEERYKHEKARLSIKYYNINHGDFVKARITLRDEIENLRVDAQRYYSRLENGDADHQESYSKIIKRMRDMRKESAPYSAFCVAITDAFRGDAYLFGIFL